MLFADSHQLGALGFLSNVVESSANTTSPNAGLLDQRYALKWVRKYIHLFGGDADRVTVIGESAGGTNIAFQITAFGGAKLEEQLFHQAILQSSVISAGDPHLAAVGANRFLERLEVTSVDEARRSPTKDVIEANKVANSDIPNSATFFGPSIDGELVLDQPARQLQNGNFYQNLNIITSSNKHEGLLLANKSVTTDAAYNTWVSNYIPSAPAAFRARLTDTLYPATYDGSQNYTEPQGRLQKTITEVLFACSTYAFARAYDGKTHNLLFAIPPAYHAQDLAYTWYPTGETPGFVPAVARQLQAYYASFVLTGRPVAEGERGSGVATPPGVWPRFGAAGRIVEAVPEGVRLGRSEYVNERCEYIAGAAYAAPLQMGGGSATTF